MFGAFVGPLFLGPGFGALVVASGLYAAANPGGESIFAPADIPSDPAGVPFIDGNFVQNLDGTPAFGSPGIRLTYRAVQGMGFDSDPMPGAFLQSATITFLAPWVGNLNLALPTNDPSACAAAGPLGNLAPCPPSLSLIDPTVVYDWVDGGNPDLLAGPLSGWVDLDGVGGPFSNAFINPNAYPSKIQGNFNTYTFAPARTNMHSYRLHFASTGVHTIDPGELNGNQWYEPIRYDDDMAFLPGFQTIQFSQDNVTFAIDKTRLAVPCFFDHRGPFYPANPIPLVTDYTEISGQGAIKSAQAAALSPISSAINTAAYGHSDMLQADDSQAGKLTPGTPGASAVTDPLIGWIMARRSGVSILRSSRQLGVYNAR